MILLAFWLVGAIIYGVISAAVAAIVWMFTTVFGLVLVGLFIVVTLINLFGVDERDDE